jgi:phage terminase large subunit GpA-like protein
MDSGFRASEVYRFCLAAGWKAFKGDDAEYFLYSDPRTKKIIRRIWTRNLVDPHFGSKMAGRVRPIPLFRWSNNGAKDMLAEMMRGLVGDWTLPRNIGSDYLKQVTAERREEKEDTKGRISYFWKQVRRDNHLLDCELMILIAAVITRMIGGKKGSQNRAEARKILSDE